MFKKKQRRGGIRVRTTKTAIQRTVSQADKRYIKARMKVKAS